MTHLGYGPLYNRAYMFSTRRKQEVTLVGYDMYPVQYSLKENTEGEPPELCLPVLQILLVFYRKYSRSYLYSTGRIKELTRLDYGLLYISTIL